MHEDYVGEFPQSGEKIRGRQFASSISSRIFGRPAEPGLPQLRCKREPRCYEDDPEYGGDRLYACEVIDFQEGKIKRVRAYFGEPFEAPKWWARWVESMEP
jgi:hypothetical protein